jgi:hypothetical protein
LEYSSDDSESEFDDQEEFHRESNEHVLEKVLPTELRQGWKKTDVFVPIHDNSPNPQDKKNDDDQPIDYDGIGTCSKKFSLSHHLA